VASISSRKTTTARNAAKKRELPLRGSRIWLSNGSPFPSATKKIAGVCSGIAHYLNVDVTLVRIVW